MVLVCVTVFLRQPTSNVEEERVKKSCGLSNADKFESYTFALGRICIKYSNRIIFKIKSSSSLNLIKFLLSTVSRNNE